VLLEQSQLTLVGGQSLAEHNDAIVPITGHRPVTELGEHLLKSVDCLEVSLLDNPRLVSLRQLPRDRLDRPLRALQVAVCRLWQLLGPIDQVGHGIDPEDEPNATGVPSVEVLGLREVRVTPKQKRAETGFSAQ